MENDALGEYFSLCVCLACFPLPEGFFLSVSGSLCLWQMVAPPPALTPEMMVVTGTHTHSFVHTSLFIGLCFSSILLSSLRVAIYTLANTNFPRPPLAGNTCVNKQSAIEHQAICQSICLSSASPPRVRILYYSLNLGKMSSFLWNCILNTILHIIHHHASHIYHIALHHTSPSINIHHALGILMRHTSPHIIHYHTSYIRLHLTPYIIYHHTPSIIYIFTYHTSYTTIRHTSYIIIHHHTSGISIARPHPPIG